jgi:type II secretory pathway pseudopilin PulG
MHSGATDTHFELLIDGFGKSTMTHRKSQQRSSDGGYSLVEVIVSIALISTVGLALLAAANSAVTLSSSVDNLAKAETILSNAADRVNRAGRQCGYEIYAELAAVTEGWQASQVKVVEKHYDPSSATSTPGVWADDACPGSIVTPDLVQLVTVTVTLPNSSTQRTIQVVKSEI